MPRLFAGVLLGVTLLASGQAAEVNPARWEKDIAAFEASDRTNPPPKEAVLFIGSSSIRMWNNLKASFPEIEIISRGFGGSQLPDATHFAERIIFPYRPAKIVLYEGDNDIAAGRSPQQVLADFREFVRKVQSELPRTEIYFLAIKPSPSRWHLSPQSREANRLIKQFCRIKRKVEYIDVWTPLLNEAGRPDPAYFLRDNLHLNEKGYARWTPVIRKALKD